VSSPRSVPSAVIRAPGTSRTIASAKASAGSMCPALPPPAITTDGPRGLSRLSRGPTSRRWVSSFIVGSGTPGRFGPGRPVLG
jgi:hypothetical protein